MNRIKNIFRLVFRDWNRRNFFSYFALHGPNLNIFNFIVRPWLLRRAGVTIGKNTSILSQVQVTLGKLVIGDEVFINTGCRLACAGGIFIDDFCQIGAKVIFETINHELSAIQGTRRASHPAPIYMEDNVWIGSHAVLLPGITIGVGAVVAAGAVVTHDVRLIPWWEGYRQKSSRS